MAESKPTFDWRVPATWAVILAIFCLVNSYIGYADGLKYGHAVPFGWIFAVEATSHLTLAALIPALYWMQRRFPLTEPVNWLAHVAALLPFSFLHTAGMTALRLLWFSAILGRNFEFPLTFGRLSYEFPKDIATYFTVSIGIIAFRYLRQRVDQRQQAAPTAPGRLPERFAVRKRGGNEVMVEVADIDWIEASGNYAILHVGGETFEIRSSLAKLEGELDPKRFVRVHKSHVVNISRVTEVTPWVSGDWRIRLQGGAEVNLSRRYRQRFEALAPVRS